MRQEIKPRLMGKYVLHGPQILGVHRVYIQTRQEKRINFTIGGRAYLLPKTSVVIKCPVRRFQKSLIQWEKDGQRLQISKRLGITKSGSLKIHSLEALDIGVYKCIAGSAQETFVLKLIGTDNRLIEPPAFRKQLGESGGTEHNEANSFGAKWYKMSQMWQLWNQKSKQYLGDGQVNDQPFLRHLETRTRDVAEGYGSHEFRNRRLEAVLLPGAYSMDTVHFEELVKNLSHLVEAGEVNDDLASQFIYQLIAELSKPPRSASERLKEPRDEKLPLRKPAKAPSLSDNHSTKPHESVMRSQKGPVLVRQKGGPRVYSNRTVTVHVGSTVFVTRDARIINLLCETVGASDPQYNWTKDGTELKSSEKVVLAANGKIQILNPTQKEMGVYRCTVENDFGSDVETSALFYAEAPTILSSAVNVTALELSSFSVTVGGTILARAGANILLECPVRGLPQPDVAWFKNGSSARNHLLTVVNNSLLLRNFSSEDPGTYICTATNALGKAAAKTVLRLAGERLQVPPTSSSSRKKRIMASGASANISVAPGDLLRIGCPVHPSTDTIHWSFKNRPIEEILGSSHRTLVEGRVLEVNIVSDQLAGPYKCWTASTGKPLSVWVNVTKEAEPRWEFGDWSPCSSSCGNSGTQVRRLLCVSPQEQRVNKSLCKESQKPAVNYRSCNIQDCPPRWVTSSWSECSVSCGHGFRQRQRVCKQVRASGVAVTVPPAICAQRESPSERKPCMGHSCTGWMIHPWGQCAGRCIGHAVGSQHRLVRCQHRNGSAVSQSSCDERKRPPVRRNCSTEKCDIFWQVGPWRPCSVDCGSGFQSRQVDCIHRRSKRPVADQHCAWRKRPATWQHCSVTSCDKGECKDSTHYCTFVKHLKLCLIEVYKQRCCQSCGEGVSSLGSS